MLKYWESFFLNFFLLSPSRSHALLYNYRFLKAQILFSETINGMYLCWTDYFGKWYPWKQSRM